MKRKEIKDTIAAVGAASFTVKGSITLLNQKTGEGIDVDMPSTLAIVRGTLAWVDTLLEDGAQREKTTGECMQKLLSYVGTSIASSLSDDEK